MPANFIPIKSQRRPSEPIGSRESKREKPNESKSFDRVPTKESKLFFHWG